MNLSPKRREDHGKKTLVLDLDETLVHSSFRPTRRYDFIINVEIEARMTTVYVLKRPYVDRFLQAISQRFEVVVFTASLRKYADPWLDVLDHDNLIQYRLYRNSCRPIQGGFVKACLVWVEASARLSSWTTTPIRTCCNLAMPYP